MAELQRQHALHVGGGDPLVVERPGLRLQADNTVRKLRLQVRPAAAGKVISAMQQGPGLALPEGPRASVPDQGTVYWLAPGDWLLLDAPTGVDAVLAGLADTHALTDASDALSVIVMQGRNAAALLAEGCSVDLYPAAFPPGSYALTRLQHLPVTLHRLADPDAFRVLVDSPAACFLWDWLADVR